MPNFKFGQPVTGNVYSLGNTYRRNATTRTRTQANCGLPATPSIPGSTSMSSQLGGGYDVARYNPAYDRLEEGSVIEDWIPRDLSGLNKLFRIIYTRDSICGPAIDIMSNLPWSSFDVHGVDDPGIRRFYEDAAQLFGDKAQEMPAITIEYLVLGRFCASLIYDESKGFWTDFVPHDSDFLTITPIPIRGFDPKIDLRLSPGVRQFVHSTDYRDVLALSKLPESLLTAMRRGQPIPLDPINTLYLRRKSSPTDFVGTSALCVTGDTLVSTALGLRRIDSLYDGETCPAGNERLEVEHVETVATTGDKPAKTSHWVYSGVHPTITMRSRYGYTVTGTHKHPVLTLNPATLETEWVRLDRMSPGSLVAVDVSSQVWPVEPRVIDDVIERMRPVRADAKRYAVPRTMTTPLARLLGYLVSEGYVGRWVQLGNMDADVADDFADTFLQVFPDAELNRATRKDGYHLVTCYSSHIRSFLRAILDEHTTTDTKQIPQVILESTREHAAAFLASLYEGDGSATEDEALYYSKSMTLLAQVQTLLLKFGILAQKGTRDRCLLLSTQGVFRDRFVEAIGFRTKRKNQRGQYETDDGRIVQSDIWSVNEFYRLVVSRNANDMAKLADISPAAAAKIRDIEALGYFWDTVESLTDGGRQPVYDLCVPGTHAFVGNGVVVHNTRIVPYWAVEKALMNAMVTAARRRAGNILHITAGIDERWEPSPEELSDLAGLFIQAEEDPVGAVLATRTGVDASEVRSGGDIWKWSDEWQWLSEAKMRGMGISEALLSGDACVTADTLVPTTDGLLSIGEIRRKSDGEWQDINLTVASRHGPGKAVKWLYNGVKPTLQIKTDLGYELTCTHNHPFLVLRGMRTEWVRADELRLGDLLCVDDKRTVRNRPLSFTLSQPVDVAHGGQRKPLKRPNQMTPELAFLLGLIVSESSIRPSASQVRFSTTDERLHAKFTEHLGTCFGLTVSMQPTSPTNKGYRGTKPCYESIVCSKTLVEWLQQLGCVPSDGHDGARHKVVPWSILQADHLSQLAYLAGFIEGAGSTAGHSITLHSSSHTMLRQLQTMLAAHGFISRRYDDRVSILTSDSVRLWEQICGFMLKTYDRSPAVVGRVGYELPLEPWRQLLSEHIFTPVTSIEDAGEQDVYDLSMQEGTEPAFVANSLMIHNTYANMETARSSFTEQILALRQYLTNQVYYRRFKTLARAHGFRKQKKANLDHRIRIKRDGHESDAPSIRDDDLSLENLTQEEAFEIPEEDLIVPTLQWHKSLLPEGDRDYLDILSTLKEEGVPIPLKVWAARGGYDLTEALDMLDEDVKIRTKIDDWKKKSGGGEEEDGAFGEADAGDSSPLWDPAQRFLKLRKADAKRCLQTLVDTVYQPGKHHVLADTKHVMRTCSELLGGDDQQVELMAYVLMRLGVCRGLPIAQTTAERIVDYLASKPGLSAKRRMQELNAAARILSQYVDDSDPVVDQTLASVLQEASGPDGLELEQPPVELAQ